MHICPILVNYSVQGSIWLIVLIVIVKRIKIDMIGGEGFIDGLFYLFLINLLGITQRELVVKKVTKG